MTVAEELPWTYEREDRVLWPMLNKDSELVPAHLIHVFGPGIYEAIQSVWPYHPGHGDGTLPINHVLHFRATDHKVGLGGRVVARYRWRLVTQRDEDRLHRAHLHLETQMLNAEAEAPFVVGMGSFWMALTRPFAAKGERRIRELPEELRGLEAHSYLSDDPPEEQPEAYRFDAADHGATAQQVFHRDRTDLFQHVNTTVYMDLACDHVAAAWAEAEYNPRELIFREIQVYFRKPFLVGEVAKVEVDLCRDPAESRWKAAVRFRHLDRAGHASERVSTALRLCGPLTG